MDHAPLFSTDKPAIDRRPITIRVLRPMLMQRHDEATPRHADEDEEITVERHLLDAIDPGDFEIIGTPAESIEDHRGR